MKKYDIFLFDADNTLYDFDKGQIHALKTVFANHGLAYSDDILATYERISIPLWTSYEKGELSAAELQTLRFDRLFNEIGVRHDSREFNAEYLHELGKCSFLIDGASEICRKIVSCGKQIFIITNGFAKTHEARIGNSPIERYVSGLFVSETVGYSKPDKRYFEHVFSHIPSMNKERVLVVGDSLSTDIAGGNVAGVDTCWFNLREIENRTSITPTYEIHKLCGVEQLV